MMIRIRGSGRGSGSGSGRGRGGRGRDSGKDWNSRKGRDSRRGRDCGDPEHGPRLQQRGRRRCGGWFQDGGRSCPRNWKGLKAFLGLVQGGKDFLCLT